MRVFFIRFDSGYSRWHMENNADIADAMADTYRKSGVAAMSIPAFSCC